MTLNRGLIVVTGPAGGGGSFSENRHHRENIQSGSCVKKNALLISWVRGQGRADSLETRKTPRAEPRNTGSSFTSSNPLVTLCCCGRFLEFICYVDESGGSPVDPVEG